MSSVAPAVPVVDAVQSAAEGRLTLFGDLSLADPEFLLLIPVAVAVTLWGRARAGRSRARMPVLPGQPPPRSVAQRLAWVPTALQVAGLIGLSVALARPLRGAVETSSVSEGVDIALVVDRSSSMGYRDMEAGRTRLEVVKDVVAQFARRRMTDREGASDYVGLFAFAKYPQELCPFTLDVDAITGFLERLEIVSFKAEDGTGIGIALAKTVAVLRETDAESKVIVLLTDGENNLDLIAPLDAAELAAEEGVRVYTVFAGRFVLDAFGRQRELDQAVGTRELEMIAELTGGRFFRARDRSGLEAAYEEIERLERTRREEVRFVEHFDLYPRVLAPSFAAYLVSWLLALVLGRRTG
ncbi:MAG: VWA domain-containing protein [Planctomycetota bacterium]|nr:VWA domain-containing protein [Planctomycetota bacterium]